MSAHTFAPTNAPARDERPWLKGVRRRDRQGLGSDGNRCAQAVNSFTTVVTKQLKKGDDVALPGFGKFERHKAWRAQARSTRRPGSRSVSRPRKRKFTVGTVLRNSVAGRRRTR